MKRKILSKAQRREVYEKCGGHCAYCGCELKYEDMQIDHVRPLAWYGADELWNMLPACRSCNHYKGSGTLDSFRRMVEAIPHTLMRDSVTYKNGVRFGLIEPKPQKVVFYFEQMEGGGNA